MPIEELEIKQAGVSSRIAPSRGALVTALNVKGVDVLYLDRTSFEDEAKNVRGGIPVLFPYAGKLDNETFLAAGTKMKQHGFGRNKTWEVIDRQPDSLRLSLQPDADTRAQFPYEFRAEQYCKLLPRGLSIGLSIHNQDTKPLPVSPGWHPYFRCPAAQKKDVRCDAAGFVTGSTPDDREFDFGLSAPADGRAKVFGTGLGELALSFSPEMRHLQFWSQPGKDFICVEPFYGPNNTVNTERRCDIPPGTARSFWMRIEIFPK